MLDRTTPESTRTPRAAIPIAATGHSDSGLFWSEPLPTCPGAILLVHFAPCTQCPSASLGIPPKPTSNFSYKFGIQTAS
jgi:hypothetical protein